MPNFNTPFPTDATIRFLDLEDSYEQKSIFHESGNFSYYREQTGRVIYKIFSSVRDKRRSIHGIGKDFIKFATHLDFGDDVKDLLGLFFVTGLESVNYTGMTDAFQMMSFGYTEEETLERLSFNKALRIISKHLDADRDILACQEELIEAGLKEYAKL